MSETSGILVCGPVRLQRCPVIDVEETPGWTERSYGNEKDRLVRDDVE